jgi:hypothetical protein
LPWPGRDHLRQIADATGKDHLLQREGVQTADWFVSGTTDAVSGGADVAGKRRSLPIWI